MARSISKKESEKAAADKTSGKPPPGDKSRGTEIGTRFYEIEDSDKIE